MESRGNARRTEFLYSVRFVRGYRSKWLNDCGTGIGNETEVMVDNAILRKFYEPSYVSTRFLQVFEYIREQPCLIRSNYLSIILLSG